MSTVDPRPAYVGAATGSRMLAAVREVTLLVSLFALYEVVRHLVRHRASMAFSDADALLSIERALPLPREATVQQLALHAEPLVRAANVFYVSVHFPVTIAFLVFMWLRRPASYGWARSLLVSVTMVALLLHVTFPLAPPRMISGHGFVDTMAVYGPSAYGGGTQSVTNQYAAMPSLHVAWALVVGLVLVGTLPTRWRWLALLHPALTSIVVVITANHYWLDILAAAALVLLALLAHGGPAALRSPGARIPVQRGRTALRGPDVSDFTR